MFQKFSLSSFVLQELQLIRLLLFLRAEGIVLPMRYIAPITSSQGIRLVTPASAKSADIIARVDPPAFLFTQGTSTSPATGSQTRPSIFFKVRANASAD